MSTQQPVQHHAHVNILTQNWKDLGMEVGIISFRALAFKMLNKQYVGRTSWRYQMGKTIQRENGKCGHNNTTYSIIVNVLLSRIKASGIPMQHIKVSKRT
jgi:hypothetical protein